MKTNWLTIVVLAAVAYVAWQKGWLSKLGIAIKPSASFGGGASSANLNDGTIRPVVASGGQGSGNLAPEAPYYGSVPLAYFPHTAIPGIARWTPISQRLNATPGSSISGRVSLASPMAKSQELGVRTEVPQPRRGGFMVIPA